MGFVACPGPYPTEHALRPVRSKLQRQGLPRKRALNARNTSRPVLMRSISEVLDLYTQRVRRVQVTNPRAEAGPLNVDAGSFGFVRPVQDTPLGRESLLGEALQVPPAPAFQKTHGSTSSLGGG